MKICPKCHLENISSAPYCRPCHNEYQKQYAKSRNYDIAEKAKQRKREYIKKAKDKPCQDCGKQYSWYVMDFDHLGDKLFNLSVAAQRSYSIKHIQKEIDKCDLVCANCHRERTFNRKTNT